MKKFALAHPRTGRIKHIVLDHPSAYHGINDRFTFSRGLCGVTGNVGGWTGTQMVRDEGEPEETECRRCLRAYLDRIEPTS